MNTHDIPTHRLPTFGALVRYLRGRAGYDTQQDFSDATTGYGERLTRAALSNIENDNVNPTHTTLEKIAYALQDSPNARHDEVLASITADWLASAVDDYRTVPPDRLRRVTQRVLDLPDWLQLWAIRAFERQLDAIERATQDPPERP